MYGRAEVGDSWPEYLMDLDAGGSIFDGLGGTTLTPNGSSIFDAFNGEGGENSTPFSMDSSEFDPTLPNATASVISSSSGDSKRGGAIRGQAIYPHDNPLASGTTVLDGFHQGGLETISPSTLLSEGPNRGGRSSSSTLGASNLTGKRGDPGITFAGSAVGDTTGAGTGRPSKSSKLANGGNAGALQFMPQGNGSLRTMVGEATLASTPSSASQDSPLTGTLSQTSTGSGPDNPRRDAHMASEQRRRAIMKGSFERLQTLLPPDEYRKPSKANLLQAAVNYIVRLKQLEASLRAKIAHLQRERAILGQKIHGTASSFVNAQATGDSATPIDPSGSGKMLPIAPAVPQQNPHQL